MSVQAVPGLIAHAQVAPAPETAVRPAQAATPGATVPAARPPAVPFDSANDALGAGDQILINIADLDEVKNLSVKIAVDGSLDLPLVGLVHAGGLTVTGLRQELIALYGKYVSHPQISLQITTSQNRTVSVLGEVNNPSVQEIVGPTTLLSAISKAGGVRPDAGPKVIVTREARSGTLPLTGTSSTEGGAYTSASLPLDDLLASKTPENNILLRPGDIVSIPKGSLVYVIGEVHRSGGFPLRSSGSISLIEALSLAEGLGPNAKSGSAKILRRKAPNSEKRDEIPVNINNVLAGKQTDPQMFADDILFVPTSATKTGIRRATEAILQVGTGVLIYR